VSLRDGIDVAGDRLRSLVAGMAPRERILVGLTLAVLLAVAGWFATRAMNRSTERLERQLVATQTAQAQIDSMLSQYAELAGKAEALDTRLQAGRAFAPLTWIEGIGNEMGISDKIRSVQERGNEETDWYVAQKLDLRVDGVDLRQVTDLMFRIESAPQAVRIDECRVKTSRKNRSELDVTMQISILRPLEGGE
jgi:type II secretory pathway pseudopilin PulG